MIEKQPLATGEKYLNVSILGSISVAAFKNKEKKKPSDPDFIGSGIAIWINTKKAKQEPIAESII